MKTMFIKIWAHGIDFTKLSNKMSLRKSGNDCIMYWVKMTRRYICIEGTPQKYLLNWPFVCKCLYPEVVQMYQMYNTITHSNKVTVAFHWSGLLWGCGLSSFLFELLFLMKYKGCRGNFSYSCLWPFIKCPKLFFRILCGRSDVAKNWTCPPGWSCSQRWTPKYEPNKWCRKSCGK